MALSMLSSVQNWNQYFVIASTPSPTLVSNYDFEAVSNISGTYYVKNQVSGTYDGNIGTSNILTSTNAYSGSSFPSTNGYFKMPSITYVKGVGATLTFRYRMTVTTNESFTFMSNSNGFIFGGETMFLSTNPTSNPGVYIYDSTGTTNGVAIYRAPVNTWGYIAIVFGMSSNGTTIDDQTVLVYSDHNSTGAGSSTHLVTSNINWQKAVSAISSNTTVYTQSNSGYLWFYAKDCMYDNIRVYNGAMTPTQIQTDYNT